MRSQIVNNFMNEELIRHLTGHPERMNSDSLYQLRTVVARYPYYQAARLLMLSNLYLLHDPDFTTELQRSVFYIRDRRALWQIVNESLPLPTGVSGEGIEVRVNAGTANNSHPSPLTPNPSQGMEASSSQQADAAKASMALIDAFLESLPDQPATLIPDTPVATDYLATLGWTATDDDLPQPTGVSGEGSEVRSQRSEVRGKVNDNVNDGILSIVNTQPTPNREPSSLLEWPRCEGGRRSQLSIAPKAPNPSDEAPDDLLQPEFLTETLARIYIKQKKYDRALAIIRSLYLNFPEKSIYFADQIRFLEKLVRNNQLKKDK